MNLINTAARQYANRPKDEHVPSVDAMVQLAETDRAHSFERSYNWKDLRVEPAADNVVLASPKGTAPMSHWAFGQVCRSLGAPSGYLRTLAPALAADCLNYGISQAPIGDTAKLLVRGANGLPPVIRACTSETYSRVWDGPLYSAIQTHILGHRTASGGQWQNAPTWAGEQIAGFRSDRDSFLFQIDGGSIVTDPSAGGGFSGLASNPDAGAMYRGLLVRNSEVGSASISIDVVMYRFVCGNWNLWGAVIGRAFRRRHVGTGLIRDVVREVGSIARQYLDRPASADEALIKALISHEIAHTKDAVIDELRAMGLTASQAADAYTRCEQTERVSPRSFWGIAQGLTRVSQDSGYSDDRYALDKLAATVLARGAKVAA